ncbi:uncharacterized protein LOC18427530 isoform X2 [Amborella trichopoda]|uniref:uncharacterized protein LOC18427530 isoform X2 n=1 Tax=Amborella trichopoda TaxID=13333 RepID=UPI0005D363C5|nr:uncharacterized protein LOC18427530 isoform X2 [Amborella trichopoda]|eukprot:XP_011620888.1 uncharacterized protein LOC18427530 isoform X2 [Amborella trichopoda]
MGNRIMPLLFAFAVVFVAMAPSSSAAPPGFVKDFISSTFSSLWKWLWSLPVTTKTVAVLSGRPMMQFESGYAVETVFDGSKLGIEPYSVQVSPSGDLLVLDSVNSNLYRVSLPLSRYSRARLVAGSADGYSGHVDGKLREARMNHPKGFAVDDKGNVYVADCMNMAIRKISETGVTTIAGGKWSRGGGHVDGPSEEARFSDDFDVVYVGSSCSLLVIDRGNQAIREIQLHYDHCAYQYGSSFPSVIVGSVVLGYLLALLQRRIGGLVSPSKDDSDYPMKLNTSTPTYPPYKSGRPPLIPSDDPELEKPDAGWVSFGKFFIDIIASLSEIIGAFFSIFRRKNQTNKNHSQNHHHYQTNNPPSSRRSNWPLQDSFIIRDEDEPPPLETRTPTPRKTYPFMLRDPEKSHSFRLGHGRVYYHGGEGEQQMERERGQHGRVYYHGGEGEQQLERERIQPLRHYSSVAETYYEQSTDSNNEIVFGAVQEQGGRREAVEIKPVDYGDPMYDYHNIRPRINSVGFSRNF